MAQPTQPTLKTSTSKDNILPTSTVFAKAFEKDPLITYIINHMSTEARLAYLPSWFKGLMTAASMNRASFTEANNWQSCAVFMHPGEKMDNPWTMIPAGFSPMLWNIGVKGCMKMIHEFGPKADALKLKALGEQKYYYCFFIGTLPEGQGKGLASAIMREWQDIARKDGVPIWLEATTPKSREIYARLGWVEVEPLNFGKGKAGKDGLPEEGGEGVTIWGMVWWPENVKH